MDKTSGKNTDLKRLLSPCSIAIVGASDNLASIGGQPVRFLTEFGYTGNVYPVNPRLERIGSLPCYSSVAALPEIPDLVIIAVGAKSVQGVVAECETKGAPFAVILSAGFRETGAAGAGLQEELKQLIDQSRIRVVGPNCVGIMNLPKNMHAGFGSGFRYPDLKRGTVAMVTQSGGFGMTMVGAVDRAGMGFNYIVSIGNSIDLDTLDFLEHFLECEEVKIIATYIEGIADGRRLLRIGERALELGKPILVWKAGNTKRGQIAAATHTASLATSYDLYQAAFRAGGFIEIEDAADVVDLARGFGAGKLPPGNRMAIITGSGGAGVVLTDSADKNGIDIPELSPQSIAQLKEILPNFITAGNPIDVTGNSRDGSSTSNSALRIALADPNIDQVIVRSKMSTNTAEQCKELIAIASESEKPVLIAFGPDREELAQELFVQHGISWHATPPRAARVAGELNRFAAKRRHLMNRKCEERPVPAPKLRLPANATALSEHAAKAVLSAYGVPTVGETLLALDEVRALETAPFPFPLAVKINSADIPHKTEAGGVKLGIRSLEELKAAAEAVTRSAQAYKPGASLDGVLVQQMAAGLEVIVGGLNDTCFGPTVVFGLGGVFAEALHDVTYRFAPFGPEGAREMINEIKGAAIMKGYRGGAALDVESLAGILTRVSWLLHDHRDRIAGLDINPIFLTSRSAVAADALITLR